MRPIPRIRWRPADDLRVGRARLRGGDRGARWRDRQRHHRGVAPPRLPAEPCGRSPHLVALVRLSPRPQVQIMSHRSTGVAPPRLVAVLGPTNTGKTHLAVERMLGHASGMIGLPLRLLAREIYDRIVKLRGPRAVALITGEEKIVPPRPHYWVCTVEAMTLSREVEILTEDEIQLCADPERGHVFTHRLLHARGRRVSFFGPA